MARIKNRFVLFILIFFVHAAFLSAQTSVQSVTAQDSVVQGYEAYRSGDWSTAVFLLRKSVSLYKNATPDTVYMLVMAEMHNEDYAGAILDADYFISNYKSSSYLPYINYQKGRAFYYLGEYDDSVLLLSDFCHEYPENEMYASALFWIAESFFKAYRFDTAKGLYERIVSEFPSDAKIPEAQYRIETIEQHFREEKLLYLLKKTCEEYLTAKESYEKQLKEYQTEGLVGIQRQLKSEKDKNTSLEIEVEELKTKNAQLQASINDLERSASAAAEQAAINESKKTDAVVNPEVLILKQKASEIESLLNPSSSGGK